MALLITLAVVGGLFALCALTKLGMEVGVYLVSSVKVFKSKVDATIEAYSKVKAEKRAKKEQVKEIKAEVVEAKQVVNEVAEVKQELAEKELVNSDETALENVEAE